MLRFKDRGELERVSREGLRYAYLGPSSAVSRCLGAVNVFMDPGDRSMAPHLALDGYWEPWVTLFLLRRCAPGRNVLDIGSGFGYYTAVLGAACKVRWRPEAEQPRLWAVDPSAANMSVTMETAASCGLTHLRGVPAAAGCRPGWSVVRRFDGLAGSTFAERMAEEEIEKCRRLGTWPERAEIVRVDSLVGYPAFDLVKIDAEGSDWEALRGCEDALDIGPAFCCVLEHWKGQFGGRWGSDPDAWEAAHWGWLEDKGLAAWSIQEDGGAEPLALERVQAFPERCWNVALLPSGVRP